MMDNRKHLMDCALKLIAARGYDAVGVQEIVEVSGVTKPTLYHYFGSKRGLLEAILQEGFGQLNDLLRSASTYTGDLPLTLKEMTAALFELARENPEFYRLQLALWFSPVESEGFQAVSQLNWEQHQIIEGVFISAVEQHGNMHGRHRSYVVTFLGMINTYIGMALNGLVELDNRLVERAVHQFQHGIYS